MKANEYIAKFVSTIDNLEKTGKNVPGLILSHAGFGKTSTMQTKRVIISFQYTFFTKNSATIFTFHRIKMFNIKLFSTIITEIMSFGSHFYFVLYKLLIIMRIKPTATYNIVLFFLKTRRFEKIFEIFYRIYIIFMNKNNNEIIKNKIKNISTVN